MNLKKTKRKSDKIANTAARLEAPFAVTNIVRRIRSAIGIANFPLTVHLLCSTSVGLLFVAPSYAANYTASDEASLRQAITAANADGDPSSTITLTNNIVLTSTTGFGAATKPLTIDTGSFTLSTPGMTDPTKPGNSTAIFSGGPVTVIGNGNGNIIGGDAAPAKSTAQGGAGLVQTGVVGGTASLTNSGTLTGGNGGSTDYEAFPSGILRITGKGGDGATATNTAVVNNAGGVMQGGNGGAYDDMQYQSGDQNAVAGAGGNGVTATGGTLVNNGTLLGGTGGKTFNWPTSGSVDNLFAGAGGAGAALDGGADIHINNGLMLGGIGGVGMNLGASGNGQGGSGLILTGGAKLQNNQGATITGGNGLAGGGFTANYMLNPDGSKYVTPWGTYIILSSDPDPTSGSRGGSGATVTGSNLATSNLVNYGTISGGDGAAGRTASAGGAGVTGLGYARILNFAVINAGKNGDGSLGSAVEFKNGNNRLDLRTGYVINGLATAGATDWLGIGGSVDGTFDASKIGPSAQYRGFGNFEKTDSSFWTLTGETTAVTPWTLTGGILNVSSDAGLGASSGLLTFNGGTLQFANSFDMTHEVALNVPGGTVDVQNYNVTMTQRINGWGPFTKTGSGMLTLTGSLTAGGTTIAQGTLQIGNGGTTGAINNGIGNYGTLIFNRSNDYVNSSSIGGTGNVIKTGAGTLTYVADATHTGGTTVDNGTLLVGNNNTFGSWAGDVTVTGPGTFGFQRSDTATYAGVVSGTGKFLQAGKGTLVLSGANTYTGGTTITAGTLQVGDGATSGSIVGDVAINATKTSSATLAFNRSDKATLDGVISGAGNVQQLGTGTMILTGNSTYTGGTTIAAGTLQLGNGGTSGMIAGNVANAGVLAFNRSDEALFSGVISGAGSVQVNGTGTTILAANQSYTGDTTVSAGTLQIGNGTATGGLTGNGRIINNSKVVFNRSTNMNVNSVISGTGQVEQKGGRFVNLLADNTYTGGTLISNGAITLGNGGTTGSIVGDVVTGTTGTLRFNRSDNYVFNGLISGTGSVQQVGVGGTTTLTANNTYTNGTWISAGTLEVGNGGTTGSIVGDVQVLDATGALGSTLAFNRSDSYSFGGVISENGRVEQRGSGTTTLTGANTYTGTTTVKAGTLLVNGDQTAATGLTSVLSGATLGGTGIIGGDVTVANGATLAPGVSGATPGTLTINGALSLNQDSILAYRYGQANVPGGALNDLTNVKGNLTLDGKINVSLTPGGTFGPGIYRVFNYGGTLTNNGLDIGTLPAGTTPDSIYVQTSVAGQVNLANTQGLTLNYWDAKGAKNNNAIDGGTGSWQKVGGLDNWTNDTGVVNAPWQDNAFAIFQATPGTVTVDNSTGQVSAAGMQFATDGYIVTDGPLTLGGGASSIIRVGDGTAAGAGMTATINSVLQGATQLDKTDAGTLVLTGANTYTGGTAIDGGVLQVANDGNLGAASGGLTFNGGTLRLGSSFNLGSGRAITLNAPGGTIDTQAFNSVLGQGMTGAGAFTKAGAGTLTLTGSNTYAGGTTIAAGTLQLGNGGTSGSILGDVANSGTLVFNRSDSTAFNGVVSGAGAVQQIGTGTTTLTGANTYTGGTTITAGTLQLGSGGTSGSITGNVANSGVLAFNRSDAVGFGGIVSGSGSLQQIGTGTTTLTGANTYTGGTTITAGTLQLGNGGTTGSILGDVADNGTLAFNRSDDIAFDGIISGTGAVQKLGAGVLTLTGTNSYGGATTVKVGTLLVNGDQTAATGLTSVLSGATLGGTGTIGGDVTIANGATLAPGLPGATPGTLTINGALGLNQDSILAYRFGQANVPGGALNDLTNVKGDLTLDGKINVALTPGGNFGPGIYRVINYGGTLTDNGLDIGTLPAGTTPGSIYVQTSVAGQVNLANTQGLELTYWDAAEAKNNNAVNGGDGKWQKVGGLDNWTDQGGAVNARWQDNAFAIFQAKPGTVTVDNSTGQVSAAGMQFMSDGYVVSGDPLTLAGGATSIIRVGDGTNAGTGMTATISSVLQGVTQLDKTDFGTLVLSGANTYTGGTAIDGGMLQVANDGNLGAASGGLTFNGGTLQLGSNFDIGNGRAVVLNAPGGTIDTQAFTSTLAQGMTGAGAFTKAGAGTLTLAGANTYTGGTTITAGTLQIGNGGTSGSIPGNVVDNGTLAFNRSDDIAFGGVVSGAGTLEQRGSGTTTLTGTNTYTGGTTITAGTLQIGNGGTIGSITGNVTNNGTLAFNHSDNLAFAGAISGTGAVRQIGSGVATLSGNNAYSGGTFIDAGVLQVAADNNLGGAAGALTFNGGTLQLGSSFNLGSGRAITLNAPGGTIDTQAFNSTLGQGMTGAGAFTKAGTGTLVLTGANTYAGGTTISAGTLQIGNGGTAGSIAGDVADNGTLAFNRSDDTAFGGVISGTGAVQKLGAGVLTLTGSNSYGGATSVNAGTLLVNGDQTAAKGLTSVLSGATLGGTGIIGGDVTIANGATLAPGLPGATPGTLTINGALALNQDSTLAYRFGQADIAGGAFNDLTDVKGNLTLDGKINVSLTPSGTFGPGTYRVFNYGGTLTDNVLDIGTLPAGTTPGSIFVQTSVSGQVNLVNTQGLQLTYWDADGARNNNKIDGGTGTWENTGSLNNWTGPAGAINAAWAPNGFAIFQAKPGTVTVDNGNGQVSASGMQFDSDGYLVQGDDLTLAGGASSIIRVGNGTSTGAGVTATISSVLQGATQLDKTDFGTLVLTAANTYTGGTAIDGGVLQVANDGNLGAASGGLTFNGGTLRLGSSFDIGNGRAVVLNAPGGTIDTQGFTSTLAQGMTGAGAFTKAGNGVLTLTAANGYTGGTTIAAGTLQVGSGGTSGSILGNVVDNGTLAFNRTDDIAFGGVISGRGTLEQRGSSTLTLTGTNTYTDGTTISAGTLQIGNGGTVGSIVGNVVDNGTLALNRSNNITVAGIISGTGVVRQIGSGVTTLSGVNTYTGGTFLDAGVLQVAADKNLGDAAGALTFNGGTLQLGSSFNLGSGRAITLNAPGGTIDTQAFNSVLGQGMTGAGAFTKAGTGALTLAGANTYAGGTTISAGTLQLGNGGASGSILGNVTNNGMLAFNRSDAAGFDGIVSGNGSLQQIGTGTTILTGANTYTGGTTITAGTLQLGNGGTSGSIAGDVANSGILAFNRSDAVVYGGVVSGTGQLQQKGTGTTTLTGANTYTGGTTISAGTLQIGNSGTTGSIAGDVADNGTLAFNRSDDIAFGGVISGTGAVQKLGDGVLTLTGTNSYGGATSVNAGTLLVNGDQTAATGLTSVLSGATLGGTGTIGGDVTIANGATLAPGVPGATPGTLTINGALSLNQDSTLAYRFGQANVPGGALNDLTNVKGNLTLDGKINVALTPGGNFGPGIYRVINYGGTLTNNGLDIGTLPAGTAPGSIYVQTSVAGQVNLANTSGLTLNYWDAKGDKNNNAVDGGTGSWQKVGGLDNWANDTGAVNAPWQDNAFAIFQATPGTVTVDNSTGQVSAAGMQFATDGYIVTGGALTLAGGASSIIRVGDGTGAGAGMTATISVVLQGATQLDKTDAGTLVLTAANTYTGGTAIDGGVLQVANDGNLGAATGGLTFNGGTLRLGSSFNLGSGRAITLNAPRGTIDTQGFTSTLAQGMTGAGAFTKAGTGTLTLAGDNTYTGDTTISAGTLQLGNGGTTGSIIGNVANNGVLAFNRSDAAEFGGFVSGNGSLQQIGTGTTMLTAANTYTGGTTISAGTLQLGNGGTSGSIAGNVTNNGVLAFNRSDAVGFDGIVSGSGALQQIGTGTTTLTGANSYGGATTVSAGTLLVNGDQTAAKGLTSVASGATLGGTGIIGGDVTIANGATLAPGLPGATPGTLTINGALALNQDSTLAYRFGQADIAGGVRNDLTEVKGNLTLDGKINVALTPGGNFGPGTYRVFNYGGTLTDNVLDIGTLPAGTTPGSIFVQTSVSGQVNLVNTQGLQLTYWDAGGARNNNKVDGGTGTWENTGSLNNWTNPAGAINAAWASNGFAIFQAKPGTVTVDNSNGQVSASGMQFDSDGYLVQGDALTLAGGASSIIRVGNGTSTGAGVTATISAVLQGATQLDKTDLGTLVLTGANTYTGGTAIDGGVLQVANDGSLGAANGGLTFNDGTLRLGSSFDIGNGRAVVLNAPGGTIDTQAFNSTLAQGMTGAGAFTKAGAGTLTLAGTNTYAGGTMISAGTLQIGNGGTSGSITGNVVDNGTLAFTRSDDIAFNGVISGTGKFEQRGSGTTTLTAANTYTAGTTITAGTLQLGNGGTAGSIAGDVVDNGTLAFNRSDNIAFGGVISGTGSVQQVGSGITTLSGTNTYNGTTTVAAGTLLVNGDQSGAAGATSVASGATIGGTGIIGGNVTIADGGKLAPGLPGANPGTLTINGSLGLSQGSELGYRFGQSNVPGGLLNDLTSVKGDLTLDGTINVALTPGGTFDPGVYRVLDYGGTLTNKGLDIGTLPAGTAPGSVFVQTSVAGQVNLANASGMSLNFWDATGAKNNGAVNGGSGVWQNTGNLDNWTNDTGAINARWQDKAFAVFMAKPGTVSVDNINGQVSAAGMQFASDGYMVTGDPLTLAGGATSIIRVGDGSSVGAGFTATIDSVLQGSTQLRKTDLGTLVLNGDNTYTGGTAINGGVLQISKDGNLGAAGSGLSFAGGTLRLASSFDIDGARDIVLNAPGGTIDTQTFDSTLKQGMTGAGSFAKEGKGTLTLLGESDYTGGTKIAGGTLQLGNGGTTGSILGDVANNGALVFNRSDNVAFGGVISGTGTLAQNGAGSTMLSGANTYSGATTVNAGTLAAAATNTFSAASAVSILSGARLDLQGYGQKIAGLSNAGAVALGSNANTTLTIAGNYVGNGGTLLFSTYLGDDNSPTDRLVIHGDTSGSSQVKVINRGGPGLKTGEGIKLIQVGGASNGRFRLLGDYTYKGDPSVVAGAYAYRLFQGGTSTPNDGDWYLRSELAAGGGGPSKQFNPSAPVLETYPQQLLAMNSLPTLQQRVGNRFWSNAAGGETSTTGNPQIEGQGIWARLEGTQSRFKPGLSTSNARYDLTTTRMQAGLDIPLAQRDAGKLIGGVTLHYANGRSDVTSPSGNGGISTDGYGVGGTLTWYGTNGFYVDSQAQVTRYDSTLSSSTSNRTIAKGNRGSGYAFSLEAGQKLGVGDGFTLTPQAQLTYSRVKFDSFTDPFDAAVNLKNGDSLRGRLGVSLDHNNSWIAGDGTISRTHIYGLANLLYEFGKGSTVNVASVDFSSRPQRLWAEVGAGVSYNWGGDKYSLYGQGTVGTSLNHVGSSRSIAGTVGFRMRW